MADTIFLSGVAICQLTGNSDADRPGIARVTPDALESAFQIRVFPERQVNSLDVASVGRCCLGIGTTDVYAQCYKQASRSFFVNE